MTFVIKAHLYIEDLKLRTVPLETNGKPPFKLESDGEFFYLIAYSGGDARYQRAISATNSPDSVDDDDIPF